MIQRTTRLGAIVVWLLAGERTLAQTERSSTVNVLPVPSGSAAIGRVTYHWIDSARAEFLDERVSARRELLVDVWYPAARTTRSATAPYLPNLPLLRRALPDSMMRRRFAPAYALMEAGRLWSHAVEGAPAHCPRRGCPVLIFSHGGGVDRSFYTAQYEDLASHGYVVAAIAHTFDTHLVVFSNGRVVRYAPQPRDTTPLDMALPQWRRELQRDARSQAYVRRVINMEAGDIRFVIDRLTRYAQDSGLRAPFVHQLDLTRIGALGHSAGGEAAARGCQLDRRIKACLNQDGAMHNLPFSRDSAGRTMDQPFLYFTRAYHRPVDSDSALAAMGMTRAEHDSLIADIEAGPGLLLSNMPGGAYRVSLNTPGVTHMSFSDEPLLEAVGDSVKRANALRALGYVESYSRAFFDKMLLGRKTTVLDVPRPADSNLVVEWFPRRPVAR